MPCRVASCARECGSKRWADDCYRVTRYAVHNRRFVVLSEVLIVLLVGVLFALAYAFVFAAERM